MNEHVMIRVKKVAWIGLICLLTGSVLAQVDIEHRRVLSAQTGIGVVRSDETPSAFGYFWFNENHCPWTNSAWRLFFAGVYASSELSYFLPANTNVAVGAGLGGGGYVDSVTAYVRGERIDPHSLYGDTVEGHLFLNQTIPNPTPLPLNLRATYGVSGSFYRSVTDDPGLVVPASFLTQTILAEFRFGGIQPGLLARQGLELYFAADANYRSGNDAMIVDRSGGSPVVVALTPSSYQRLFGSLAGKVPLGQTTIYGRVGGGLGGGGYVNSVTAYVRGERIDPHSLYGDTVEGHLFLNQTIPNPTPLPLNLRATYGVSGSFYRRVTDDPGLVVPSSFLTQTILAEFRFGGIEPGLLARQGLELYFAADANYRSGNDATIVDRSNGLPVVVALTPSSYQRLYGSLAGKAPLGRSTIYGRVGGGLGQHLDELSAWKLGGNLTGIEPFNYTMHGYYTREILAEDFLLANLAVSQQLTERHRLAVHVYGDYAQAKTITPFMPGPRDWHGFIGVGAGVSCRALWETDLLLSYGYGVNAVRKGETGGHEIGLALEKKF